MTLLIITPEDLRLARLAERERCAAWHDEMESAANTITEYSPSPHIRGVMGTAARHHRDSAAALRALPDIVVRSKIIV